MKKEALKLADWLEDGEVEKYDIDEASAMIRRLVEEFDKQKEKSDTALHTVPLSEADRNLLNSNESISQHKAIMRKNAFNEYIPLFLGNDGLPEGTLLYTKPQTKPLSDEEMMKVIEQVACSYDPYEIEMSYDYEIRVARAIEERHGIK